MSSRKIAFVEGEIYHICNRGVEKRDIFIDDKDHYRFIQNLYGFNDENEALHPHYRQNQLSEALPLKVERKPIVSIHIFTLMPNHYHLLLSQKRENGITNFMHKLGTGYAMYFNEKYQRSGAFFQGKFKAVRVEREAHMTHLPFYIHANPLDLKFPGWRRGEISDSEQAIKFLEEYKWSSFPDYIGKNNFRSIVDRSLVTDMFGGPEKYHKMTKKLLKEMDLERVREVALEEI